MGYRLDIRDKGNPELNFYGTKLFGYVNPETLHSKLYLKKLFPDYDMEASAWEGDSEITLSAEQFREFIRLYSYDWKQHCGEDIRVYSGWKNVEKMLQTKSEKVLNWS